MNTQQAAAQLRLAADIMETGHPWEYRTLKDACHKTITIELP